ncbi:c-type cytochrome [Rothia nasimurium]|uniref:C-type cytochrome n=1 Tax=Luteibacter anthropi TaxID=564369 RepID=A0A7X5ZHI1_9GAMM|nr:c-type cytochrome [Luteibacter anthropi]
MRYNLRNTMALAFVLARVATLPAMAGDAQAGNDVFKTECAECHSVKEGRNKKGPSLFGVVGRKAATLPDYDYSDALRGQTTWVWTPEQLHTYLSQPASHANPGTRMKYDGLSDPKQLDDLISYLGTLH